MTVGIAAIGAQRDFVLAALDKEFTLHKVWDAPDRAAALRPVAAVKQMSAKVRSSAGVFRCVR